MEGTFLEMGLQAVNIDYSIKYHVEKILKRHVQNKRKEVHVHWVHCPKKYYSWSPEADFEYYPWTNQKSLD